MEIQDKYFSRLKTLTELPAISNDEGAVRKYLRSEMTNFVDSIEVSGLGNIFGIRKSKIEGAPTVMVAAHMDEVGFMVSKIHQNGTMSVVAVGGWNPYAVSAQRYCLMTEKGNYPIISAAVSPHLLKGKENSTISPDAVRFDAGFISKEEAEAFGVRPGNSIVPDSETIWTANREAVIAKAIDNRYGCAVILDALEALGSFELDYNLVIGASVQEEVGLRGIRGAIYKYQPDVFFAVDCSPAGDGEGDAQAEGQLGQGFLLRMHDPGMMTHPGMIEYIREMAESSEIPYQYYFSKGGTDAGAAHTMNEGIPSAVIGLPARYIHGHQSLFRMDDYQAAYQILSKILLEFNEKALMKINSLDETTKETEGE